MQNKTLQPVPIQRDHAGVRVPPPVIHAVAMAAGFGLEAMYGGSWLPSLPVAGVVLIVAAVGIAVAAFRQFADADNPVPPNQPIKGLMTAGPFRFSRNPLYLGLALMHAGLALLLAKGWLLLTLLPALLVVRYYVIAREEAYLTRRFGMAYSHYQARVRRWL